MTISRYSLIVPIAALALAGCGESAPRNHVERMMQGKARAASTRLSEYVSAHHKDPKLPGELIGAGFKETFTDAKTDCHGYRYTKKTTPFRTREAFVRLCPQEHVAQVSYS